MSTNEAVQDGAIAPIEASETVQDGAVAPIEFAEPPGHPELVALVSAVTNSDPPVKKSQIADVICCSSVPGFWAVQLSYRKSDGWPAIRTVYVGPDSYGKGQYKLWKTKFDYVEARFDDYDGIVLVPCPEVVCV